jgi:hypothetical protein
VSQINDTFGRPMFVNPQYEAHERFCKSIGDMAKENKRLEERIKMLENLQLKEEHLSEIHQEYVARNVCQGGQAVSLNQYPEWIKRYELNAIQGQEIIALKERIKRLEDTISRAAFAFFRDGSDRKTAIRMLEILDEERKP